MDNTKVLDSNDNELIPGHIYLFNLGKTNKGVERKRLAIYKETTFRKMKKPYGAEYGPQRYVVEVEVIASNAAKPSLRSRPMIGYTRTSVLDYPPDPVDPPELLLYTDMPNKYIGFDMILQGDLSPLEVPHA